jgi:hypothetical protein
MVLTAPSPTNTTIDKEIRELAYGLWASQAGRSPKKTSDLLAAMGHPVQPDTISHWTIRDNWAERVDRELSAALPGMRRETALNLVAQGVIAARIRGQMLADLERDGKVPDKASLMLVDAALNFAGFSPVGHDRVSGASGGDQRRGALTHLSEEEYKRIVAGGHR